jgi:hypothetical protein
MLDPPPQYSAKWFGKLPRCATAKTILTAGSTAVTVVLVMLKAVEQAGAPVQGLTGAPLSCTTKPLLSYWMPLQVELKVASLLVVFSSVQPPSPVRP